VKHSWVLVIVAVACAKPTASPVIANVTKRTDPLVVATSRDHPFLLVADAKGAYWCEDDGTAATVYRATRATMTIAVAFRTPYDITASADDDGELYLGLSARDDAAGARIAHVVDGGERMIAQHDGLVKVMAVDRYDVYSGNAGGGFFATPKAGGATRKLADSVEYSYVAAFAIDARYAYFSNELDDTPPRIYRVPLAGGEVQQVNDAGPVHSWTVGRDSVVYYEAPGALWRARGAEPESTRVATRDARILAVDGDRLLVLYDAVEHDHTLRDVSIATGDFGKLAVPLGVVGESAYVGGVLWFVRGARPEQHETIVMVVP
jgi:hypothetical protein